MCYIGVHVGATAKMAELIDMLFWLWTRVSPRKHVFHGSAHSHHLANTIEPSMCGGDAASPFVKLL